MLWRKLRLKGSVKFENHANAITPERQVEDDMQQMSLSGNPRRRSPRLLAQAKRTESLETTEPPGLAVASAAAAITSRSGRPRADQFCVYKSPPSSSSTSRLTS